MCRLTKKQTQQLRTAIEHLRRSHRFLYGRDVVIGKLVEPINGKLPLNTYETDAEKLVQVIDKQTQGEMNGLDFAMRHLLAFMEVNGFEEPKHRARVVLHDTL